MESKKNYSKTFNPYNAKHRNCLFTLFDIDKYQQIRQYLTNLKNFQYLVAAKEICPETKREHIHIYCQFKKPSNVSQNKCFNAHLDVSRGTPEQNIKYVKKDGNILDEIGEHKTNAKTRFVSYNEIKKMTPQQRGELSFINANIIEKFNYRDQLKFRKSTQKKGFLPGGYIFVKYIWGPSGSGKSELAMNILEGIMGDDSNKFWDNIGHQDGFWHGISGETEYAFYDEFRDTQMPPYKFINFIDYNIHSLNIKGCYIMNKYKYIVITSTQNPREIYANMKDRDEPSKQWLRRMEIIHLQQLKQLDDTQTQVVNRLRKPGVNVPDYELFWQHKITEYISQCQEALKNPIKTEKPSVFVPLTLPDDVHMETVLEDIAIDEELPEIPENIVAFDADDEVPEIPEDLLAIDGDNNVFTWDNNSNNDSLLSKKHNI